jgi:hypothetical protein
MGEFGFGGFSKASLFGGRGHGRDSNDHDDDRDDDERDAVAMTRTTRVIAAMISAASAPN